MARTWEKDDVFLTSFLRNFITYFKKRPVKYTHFPNHGHKVWNAAIEERAFSRGCFHTKEIIQQNKRFFMYMLNRKKEYEVVIVVQVLEAVWQQKFLAKLARVAVIKAGPMMLI